jgi:hypothetical protein
MMVTIRKWCRDWIGNRQAISELQSCSPEEFRRIAADTGASPDALKALAARWPDSAGLLSRRMSVLNLDENDISRTHPAVVNDLRRLCSLCSNKGQCEHDLDCNPADSSWRGYCPNTVTLTALKDEKVALSKARKKR